MASKNFSAADVIDRVKLASKSVVCDHKVLGIICYCLLNSQKGQSLILVPDTSIAQDINSALDELCHIANKQFNIEVYDEIAGNSKEINPGEKRISKMLMDILNGKTTIVCSVESFIRKLPHFSQFKSNCHELKVGDKINFNEFTELLTKFDYDNECQITNSCEFAVRGGLIDVFSPIEEFPARIDFFGDEIESIRLFSSETQKTFSKENKYSIAPRYSEEKEEQQGTVADYFPHFPSVIIVYPNDCRQASNELPTEAKKNIFQNFIENARSKDKLFEIYRAFEGDIDTLSTETAELILPILDVFEGDASGHLGEIGKELYSQMRRNQIVSWIRDKYNIIIFVETSSGLKLISEWLENNEIPLKGIKFEEKPLHNGFILIDSKYVFLTEKEIYYLPHKKNYYSQRSFKKNFESKQKITTPELEVGDYVVHLLHGIGIYHGITEIESSGASKEVLEVEYEDGIRLFVPIWQAYLLTRYVGTKKDFPVLSRIGSGRWSSVKEAAMASAKNLAAELLRIQAVRLSGVGFSFPEDTEEMSNFERSFPFTETSDQLKAISDVKRDLIALRPMDRLICGDVGFGKTEVAMRAAFRAVMAGKQVAILAPTTILAQQHYYTFTERFSEHPVIIEVLSRFRSASEQKKTLIALAEGKVDIVIGTHRLVQNDVCFPNLGLLIIDEEQKFGVQHKEKLKRMRATVDILTMTATPIPRTLYLALSGIRDLSTIETAPVNRLPIQTVLCKFDDDIIVKAITNEVKRNGQVFFIHNRVKSIDARAYYLRNLLPGIRIEVGHGQMDSDELERVMSNFIDGKVDVLLCSTIIESGVDIPNANTIIIERSDMFGLAELYQLRGRVGRWTKQAYAYLLIPDSAIISNTARERLSAIKKYTQLGAGFRLALKDLEIRGTGNILGAQQSGHINAVGFNLYCQLLKSSVSSLKNNRQFNVYFVDLFFDFIDFSLTPVKGKINACFPLNYIPSENLRVDFYIRSSEIWTLEELDELKLELADRFGKLPIEAERFMDIMAIRIMVGSAGYNSLSIKDSHIFVEGANSKIFLHNEKIPKLKTIEPQLKLIELKRYTKENIINAKEG